MNDQDLKVKSKKLAWLLRHGANESKLAMDSAGFARVDDVLRLAHLSRDELLHVIEENNKSRYELDGDGDGARVRACQGHSTEGTPVTHDGLEATWVRIESDTPIFHGTNVASARSILVEGMRAMARTHVHLAETEDAKVGKRANVDVLLAVSPPKLRAHGLHIFRAPNGVLLAREVPRDAIVDVAAQSKAGTRGLDELQSLLASRA